MRAAERKSDFKFTTDIPKLAREGKLWGVCYEDFAENWPCHKRHRTVLIEGVHSRDITAHHPWTVREITKSSSTFSATNISSNIVWLLQLHDTIQTKPNFGTKFSGIYLANWEKHLVFRLLLVNLQRAKDGTHMFDAKYRYVFLV